MYQLHPKKEKHSRKLLTLLVSFVVGCLPRTEGNADAQVQVLKSAHRRVFLKLFDRSYALMVIQKGSGLAT